MPSKKKKYNARFPAGRIKKIMQTDEEVGKVAQAVPVIISFSARVPRTLELFVESLLTKTLKITNARNAKTLSPSHMKQCIISESRFDFLRDLVKNIPDMGINEELSGSEAGYGNEGTSPASTSTSSSSASYSNGGAAAATASASASLIAGHHHHLPYEMVHPASLQRSESYTPATASISLLPQHHHHNSQPSHGKRGLSQGASLNFYKEIPLEGTESPPPPKLSRLNSAPAGGAPTTPLSFKIDILPNLPAGSATTVSSPVSKPVSTHQPSSGAITPQITYNFERLAAAAPSAPSLEPVIKLDYSNLRLPATSASPHGSRSTGPVPVPSSSSSSLQPTIKIDLSSLATGGTTALSGADGGGRTPKKLTETGVAGAGGSKQYASPTTSTATLAANSAAVQSPVASALTAPPLFSALSSTIPGMDEDYDDI